MVIETFLTTPSGGKWTVPLGITFVNVCVVAGGGAGGNDTETYSGGGGAGGYIYRAAFTVTSGAEIDCIVGDGGTGGGDGSNSIFGSLIAIGGGAGGIKFAKGRDGGSGGGGAGSTAVDKTGGSGDVAQGHDGGTGGIAGGGGGGAAEAGHEAYPPGGASNGGAGGDGIVCPINGIPYGGGGGGCSNTDLDIPPGGLGGGGSGENHGYYHPFVAATDGVANTGGGGGGTGASGQPFYSTKGGSGIIVVFYGETIIHLQDMGTNFMFPIKLYINMETPTTYSANLNPFLIIPEDFTEASTITFGEKISAMVIFIPLIRAIITIGMKLKTFAIITPEGIKTFVFNRTFKTLDFIKNLMR